MTRKWKIFVQPKKPNVNAKQKARPGREKQNKIERNNVRVFECYKVQGEEEAKRSF